MAGLIDTGINYRKQANAAFGQVAKNAAELANANRRLNAADKAGKLNAAGQGLGMGYMAYESGLLGKGAAKMGMSKGVVDALTPTPPTTPTVGPTVQDQMLSQPAPTTSGPGGQTVGDAMESGEMPSGTLSSAADAPLPTEAATTATEAGAAGGNVTSLGGPLGGAINGAASGFASGMASGGLGTGIAGGVGGGLGGAVGGTIAAPLQLAGTAANAISAGSGAELLAAGSDIAAGGATAGAGALEGLATLIAAF